MTTQSVMRMATENMRLLRLQREGTRLMSVTRSGEHRAIEVPKLIGRPATRSGCQQGMKEAYQEKKRVTLYVTEQDGICENAESSFGEIKQSRLTDALL